MIDLKTSEIIVMFGSILDKSINRLSILFKQELQRNAETRMFLVDLRGEGT